MPVKLRPSIAAPRSLLTRILDAVVPAKMTPVRAFWTLTISICALLMLHETLPRLTPVDDPARPVGFAERVESTGGLSYSISALSRQGDPTYRFEIDWPTVDGCSLLRESSRRLHDEPNASPGYLRWLDDNVADWCSPPPRRPPAPPAPQLSGAGTAASPLTVGAPLTAGNGLSLTLGSQESVWVTGNYTGSVVRGLHDGASDGDVRDARMVWSAPDRRWLVIDQDIRPVAVRTP